MQRTKRNSEQALCTREANALLSLVEASCGLAPGLSQSSPHLPTLPLKAGEIMIHASGHSVVGLPSRSHKHSWERLRGRVFRGQAGRRSARFSPKRVGLLCHIRRGLVHNLGDFQPLAQRTTHTHTHSYSSSSLFRSTDGHTPRDEEKARGDERCRVRSCIVVDESPVESLRHRSLSPTLCLSAAAFDGHGAPQFARTGGHDDGKHKRRKHARTHTHTKEERSGLKAANLNSRKNKN